MRGRTPADAEEVGASEGQPGAPRRRKLNVLLVALATLGALQLVYLNLVESDRMLVLRREVARLEADVARLSAEERRLDQVAAHGDDQGFREQLARKQGFIGPDELRIVTERPFAQPTGRAPRTP